MTIDIASLALVAALVAALGIAVALLVRRNRELTRMAATLACRDPEGNERITLEVRSAGLVAIAQAINDELDRERERRIADRAARGAFQQDLASLSHDIRTPLAGAQGYLQLAQRGRPAHKCIHPRKRCMAPNYALRTAGRTRRARPRAPA